MWLLRRYYHLDNLLYAESQFDVNRLTNVGDRNRQWF